MYGDGAVSSPLKLETKAGFKEVKNFGVVTTDEGKCIISHHFCLFFQFFRLDSSHCSKILILS